GFTGNLREISVYFNNTLMVQLSKEMQKPRSMNLSGFDVFTPQKLVKLTSVDAINVQLRMISGNLDVGVDEKFSTEMERITKKKPPKETNIQMIFTEFGNSFEGNTSQIFKDLLPYPEQGKIYIGFPTHQTTGCCFNFAARVIPTVVRESIDLVEKTLAIYNEVLLRIAGTLCRIVYEDEMSQIKQIYNETSGVDNESDDENTSKPVNGLKVEQTKIIYFVKKWVYPISSVFIPNPRMAGFIKKVPVVSDMIYERCGTFFIKAFAMKLIKKLTFQEVIRELKSRRLCEDEIIELLEWWIFNRSNGNNNNLEKSEFMQYVMIRI
ncbi:1010_t:CDS:2, partial [Funneliformis caledonium]